MDESVITVILIGKSYPFLLMQHGNEPRSLIYVIVFISCS